MEAEQSRKAVAPSVMEEGAAPSGQAQAALLVPSDQAQVMHAFAEATEEALANGDLEGAETHMKKAIDYERAQKNWVSMVNLELDLFELLATGASSSSKKRNALKRQIAKDRNDCFPEGEKELLRRVVPERIEAARAAEGAEAQLSALETVFQEARAFFGDADASVVAVRSEIARVFVADENYEDALAELQEIREPSYEQLRLLLECQMKLAGFGEGRWTDCLDTLRELKERFGKHKAADIDGAAAFVLYKAGKLNEALQLYRRIIQRGGPGANDAKTVCAHVLLELQRPEEAAELVQSAPRTSRTVYLLGKILRAQGRAEECLAAAREMARLLEPDDAAGRATAAQLEGQALSDLGRREEALARLEEAAALCRDEGIDGLLREVYDDMGAVYNALGDKENTLKYYELAHPDGDDDDDDDDDDDEEEEEEGEEEKRKEESK